MSSSRSCLSSRLVHVQFLPVPSLCPARLSQTDRLSELIYIWYYVPKSMYWYSIWLTRSQWKIPSPPMPVTINVKEMICSTCGKCPVHPCRAQSAPAVSSSPVLVPNLCSHVPSPCPPVPSLPLPCPARPCPCPIRARLCPVCPCRAQLTRACAQSMPNLVPSLCPVPPVPVLLPNPCLVRA
jgi:hypothetical protein